MRELVRIRNQEIRIGLLKCEKLKYTPAVRSNDLSKLIFASCVSYPDRAYYGIQQFLPDIL